MNIPFDSITPSEAYFMMTQTIVPRPIAWVLTNNDHDQSYNLAPFSYFNAICSHPPLIVMSVGKTPSGEYKNTRVNMIKNERLVIHIANVDHAEAVTESSRGLPYGESEIDRIDMNLVQDEGWILPRLADADVAMECELYELHEIGPNQQAIFYCEIKQLFVNDRCVSADAKGRAVIDATCLNPLGRLGPNQYVSFGGIIEIAQPK